MAVKKIDLKAVFKGTVMAQVKTFLEAQGFTVIDGVEYGMTKGTLIVRGIDFDLQLKPITPKTGVDRYELAE